MCFHLEHTEVFEINTTLRASRSSLLSILCLTMLCLLPLISYQPLNRVQANNIEEKMTWEVQTFPFIFYSAPSPTNAPSPAGNNGTSYERSLSLDMGPASNRILWSSGSFSKEAKAKWETVTPLVSQLSFEPKSIGNQNQQLLNLLTLSFWAFWFTFLGLNLLINVKQSLQ